MLPIPRPDDAIHAAWLTRTLTAIADDTMLARTLAFKGETCAAMLGYLNRFSVDLDFDFLGTSREVSMVRRAIEQRASDLGLTIREQSKIGIQYILKYPAADGSRKTLKVEAQFPPPKSNVYAPTRIPDIDRTLQCQTRATMVANKLVAPLDRFRKSRSIAGRDLYDIHHFLMQGYGYEATVIEERWGKVPTFFPALVTFVDTEMTAAVIAEDLNTLIAPDVFQRLRKTLKTETLMLLRAEVARLTHPDEKR